MKASATRVFDLAGGQSIAASEDWLQRTLHEDRVAVAVPAWFGMADRHQLLAHLDPDGTMPIGLVSSTLAGAYCHGDETSGHLSRSAVLCLDVRQGWSAGLVQVEPDGLSEVAAWAIGPHDVAGRLDDGVVSPWLVDHLFVAASALTETESMRNVLVIDDVGVRADQIRQAIRDSDHSWADCQVIVDNGSGVTVGGEAMLRHSDGPPPSVGALAHALSVRADSDPERLAMHIVAAEHAQFPSTTRHTFDLGPNDGAPLHFDVYEQHRGAPDEHTVEHRLVVRAHLLRERGFDQTMVVTFELGSNGLLSIGPIKAWRLEWESGSLGLEIPR